MQLLKKLRITPRKLRPTISNSRNFDCQGRNDGLGFNVAEYFGKKSLQPQPVKTRTHRTTTLTGLAAVGISMAAATFSSTTLSAQEFRAPQIQGQTQQQMEHAAALKAQMLRAQREQGAAPGFAQQAFEAQQKYMAEQAQDEHNARVKMLEAQHAKAVAENQLATPMRRLPKPNQAASNQTDSNTYIPPVHITPQRLGPGAAAALSSTGAHVVLGDQPQQYPNQTAQQSPGQNQAGEYQIPNEQTVEQVAYQAPVHQAPVHQAGAYQQNIRPQNALPQNAMPQNRVVQSAALQAAQQRYVAQQQQFAQQRQFAQQQQQQQLAQQQQLSQRRVPANQVSARRQEARVAQAPPQPQLAQAGVNQAQARVNQARTQAQARPQARPQPTTQPRARTNQAQAQQPRSNPNRDYHLEGPPSFPKARLKGAPYVLQENGSMGLQDRIESLLSKPKYRDSVSNPKALAQSGSRSAQQTQPNTQASRRAALNQPASTFTSRVRQFAKAPTARQPQVDPGFSRPATQDRRIPRPVQPLYAPQRQTQIDNRRMEIERVSKLSRRIESSIPTARNSVQQVAMIEPKQDPFNDGEATVAQSSMPYMKTPTANYSMPQVNRQAPPEVSPPPVDIAQNQQRANPMRQISVLRKQEEEENQFSRQLGSQDNEGGGVFDPPEQADTTPEMKQIDDIDEELRKMRESQQENDNPGQDRLNDSKIDDLVKEMERKAEEDGDDSDSILDDIAGNDDDVADIPEKSCQEFREQLLDNSIRDIALDMSPPASRNLNQFVAISRSWTDQNGTVIATGSMVDLRRGYVIIESVGGLQKIPYAKLSETDWSAIADYWEIPQLCSVGSRGSATRNWVPQTYTWKASAICHKPLYFENVQLERYGHSHGPFLQPLKSAAHFFTSLATLPYQTAINPPNECQYALGFYRPGNCAPWLKDPIPISLDGIRRQALVSTGLAFIP